MACPAPDRRPAGRITSHALRPNRPSPSTPRQPAAMPRCCRATNSGAASRGTPRSVPPERPVGTKLVVHADQTDVHVLVDALGHRGGAGRGDKVEIFVAHEQVVVFDADRPVRSEGIFQTCADRAAPARGIRAVIHRARRGRERVVTVADDSGAALEISEETGADAISDLPREEAEAVDARPIRQFRHDQVAAAAFEARPVALRFNTEYPVRHLVTIADLAADRGASGVRSTLVRERRIYCNAAVAEKIPFITAGTAAGVETDIEAAPGIDRSDHRGRSLGIG